MIFWLFHNEFWTFRDYAFAVLGDTLLLVLLGLALAELARALEIL